MSKWMVRKQVPGPWVVWPRDGRLAGNFDTWREAMDYADRMARTVEVVLPRNPLPLTMEGEGGDTDLFVEQKPKENGVSIADEKQFNVIVLRRHELRPLALALLAIDEEMERP